MAKDKLARELADEANRDIHALTKLGLIVEHCPSCDHRTIQERISLLHSREQDGRYVEVLPRSLSVDYPSGKTYHTIGGARCLVCGGVFRLNVTKCEPVELVQRIMEVEQDGN